MHMESNIDKARYIFSTGKLIHDRILKVQSQHLSACEAGMASDLSMSQLHMIRIVWENGSVAMTELAHQMGVSPPSASVMVERLVTKGILCREPCKSDRRRVLVRIAPQAVERAQAIEASLIQFFVQLVEKIGPQTSQMWCDVLARIKVALSQDPLLQTDTEQS